MLSMGIWEELEFKKLIRRIGFLSPVGIFGYFILTINPLPFYWVMAIISLILYIIQVIIQDDVQEETNMQEDKPFTFDKKMLDAQLKKSIENFYSYFIKFLFVIVLPFINLIYSCYLILDNTFLKPDYINLTLSFISLSTILYIVIKMIFYNDTTLILWSYMKHKSRRYLNQPRPPVKPKRNIKPR